MQSERIVYQGPGLQVEKRATPSRGDNYPSRSHDVVVLHVGESRYPSGDVHIL